MRERAAMAIQRLKGAKPIAALLKMLDAPELESRYGACEVIILLKGAAKPLLSQLRQLEKDLVAHTEAKSLQPGIDQLRKLISDIENSTEAPELINLTQ